MARYRVLFKLGEGGTATAHLAVARGPGDFSKLVVVKALRPEFVDDAEAQRLLLQEANLSARFNHPNIVQVIEVFEHERRPVMVLEYLDGQTLEHAARSDRGLPLWLHLHAIDRTLRALEHAHDFVDFDRKHLGIVHRDVSPHNVILTYEGHVKLLDFGIAKTVSKADSTETGVIRGKLRYMAPEQLLAEPVDRRTDLFAIGVMLWEAAAGRKLWQGVSEAQILHRTANGDFPQLELRPELPAALGLIVAKAISASPDDRYASASELQAALAPILDELEEGVPDRALARFLVDRFGSARAATRTVIEAKLAETPAETDATQLIDFGSGEVPELGTRDTSSRRTVRRRLRGVLASVGVVLAAVVGLLLVLGLRSGEGAKTTLAVAPTDGGVAPVDGVALTDAGSTAPADAAQRATLFVAAFPISATLSVDGTEVSSNPASVELWVDGREHVVHAEAPGYRPSERTVVLDVSRSVVLHLAPRARTRRDGGATSGNGSECNPPFYFDPRGIKVYRPQCFP